MGRRDLLGVKSIVIQLIRLKLAKATHQLQQNQIPKKSMIYYIQISIILQ